MKAMYKKPITELLPLAVSEAVMIGLGEGSGSVTPGSEGDAPARRSFFFA